MRRCWQIENKWAGDRPSGRGFSGETRDANKAKHLKPNGIGSEKQAAAASEIWKMLLPRMRHEASASGS